MNFCRLVIPFILFVFHTAKGVDKPGPLQLKIYLNDASYEGGSITSSCGGFLEGASFYLQASHMTYTKQLQLSSPKHLVVAQQGFTLYKDHVLFIGDSCHFDFLTNSGVIENVYTAFGMYFIHAKKIILNKDKTYDAYDVTISTEESNQPVLTITTKHLRLYGKSQLQASNARLNIGKVPLIWIPMWGYDLNASFDSPIRYKLSWDTGQGPQISFRYKALSYSYFNLFLRGDYRYKRGPGGAIEMDYHSPDGRTVFLSKNYGAYDTFYNDDQPNQKQTRFRFQTLFKKTSNDNKSGVDLVFDRMTDKNMPQDFNMDRFELNTQKKNRCLVFHQSPSFSLTALATPRVNGYQGFNQKIPELVLNLDPIPLMNGSCLLYNCFNLSFYDYVYSNILEYPPNYSQALQDFHAVRAKAAQQLTLPFRIKSLELTPQIGFQGIAYNNSPNQQSAYQAVLDYGLKANFSLQRNYQRFKHVITPYADYQGQYRPRQLPANVYIFSIDDGYYALNLVTFGFKQLFIGADSLLNRATINLYGLGFFGDTTYQLAVPKAGLDITSSYESLSLHSQLRWNFNNHVLDFWNIAFGYTLNALISWDLEFRYRSAYDWRKCDHNNYILDVTRPIEDLLNSPLSDKRFTFITKASLQLAPKWRFLLQLHSGWGRVSEPGYTEAKADLITVLSSSWKLNLSYMFTSRGKSHFGLKLDLNK